MQAVRRWDQEGPLGMNKEELKEAAKEAITQWLDSKFAQLGKWTLASVGALAVVALLYFILSANGWRHP